MSKFWIVIWAFAIFSSIAWYIFLLFFIGVKAWLEITQMIRVLKSRSVPGKSKE